jgi:hypothetical protein
MNFAEAGSLTVPATQLPIRQTRRSCRRVWDTSVEVLDTPARPEVLSGTLSDAPVTLEIGAVALKVDTAGLETDACWMKMDTASANTVAGGSSGAAGGVKMMSVALLVVPVTSSKRAAGRYPLGLDSKTGESRGS